MDTDNSSSADSSSDGCCGSEDSSSGGCQTCGNCDEAKQKTYLEKKHGSFRSEPSLSQYQEFLNDFGIEIQYNSRCVPFKSEHFEIDSQGHLIAHGGLVINVIKMPEMRPYSKRALLWRQFMKIGWPININKTLLRAQKNNDDIIMLPSSDQELSRSDTSSTSDFSSKDLYTDSDDSGAEYEWQQVWQNNDKHWMYYKIYFIIRFYLKFHYKAFTTTTFLKCI